ncbi:ComF family protein [Candidatus Gottesmanbacteria bacterium]|nr:ComF family protein [Candidatus Gottesmanbacteria bacterium]
MKIRFTTHQICPVCEGWAIDGMTHPKCKTKYTIDGLTSFFHYDAVIKKGLKLLKYRFVSDLTEEFIDLISLSSLQSLLQQFSGQATTNNQSTMFIPIPLHPSRQKFRGFNQAEVLGIKLAKKLNISIRTDILKRVKKTIPQVEMQDREKRLKNMENVFLVNQLATNDQLPIVILFDDVFTTGATLRAAANALKRKGVKKVWGIVMAHG